MLERFVLKNFKCFERLDMRCAPLTLLCGLNGMGKSSVIQALLILHQSWELGELLEGRLVLGGEFADMGTGVDVLFEDAADDYIGFELHSVDIENSWKLKFEYERSADQLAAEAKREHRPPSYVPMDWRPHPPFEGELTYISAERIGPRKSHPRSETLGRRRSLGTRGEFSINFLNDHRSDLLTKGDPRIVHAERGRLEDVLDDWLQEITPGAHLDWETVSAADALIAGFRFDRKGDIDSRRYRATNVGFGLSYVLPVLIALLAPRKGTSSPMVLIENPEAHLHPQGQTRLGELAARAAMAGVQLFIETHSDHFMDGVRIAVRDGVIPAINTAFHYFSREDGTSVISSPKIDENGRLSSWPNGFFDQNEKNMTRLLSPRSNDA